MKRRAKRSTPIPTDTSAEEESLSRLIHSLRPHSWRWSRQMANDIPLEVDIRNDGRVAILHPFYSIGTVAVFGDMPLNNKTIAYWEIHVPAIYGTSMMFGIGQKTAKRYSLFHFEPLLGIQRQERDVIGESLGLSHQGILYGNGPERRFCDQMKDRPTTVGQLFNGPERWLAYFVDGTLLGIAFSDINTSGDNYYPMVSSTSQQSVFEVCSQSCLISPTSLLETCLERIVNQLFNYDDSEITSVVENLQLPASLSTRLHSELRRNLSKRTADDIQMMDWMNRPENNQADKINDSLSDDDESNSMASYTMETLNSRPSKRIRIFT